MAKEKRFPIVEIFGPTIQGEGLMCGQVTHFIRFGGCGYRCSWCDSMYAVDPAQVKKNSRMMTEAEIFAQIEALGVNTPWITLSGGDPCLQSTLFDFDNMSDKWRFAVETQGQFFPRWLENIEVITISPKPPSSGMHFDPRPLKEWYRECGQYDTTALKVVVEWGNHEDLQFANELAIAYPHVPFYAQPVTVKGALQYEFWKAYNWLCEAVCQWNLSLRKDAATCVIPQLHAVAFADGEVNTTGGFRVPMESR